VNRHEETAWNTGTVELCSRQTPPRSRWQLRSSGIGSLDILLLRRGSRKTMALAGAGAPTRRPHPRRSFTLLAGAVKANRGLAGRKGNTGTCHNGGRYGGLSRATCGFCRTWIAYGPLKGLRHAVTYRCGFRRDSIRARFSPWPLPVPLASQRATSFWRLHWKVR